MNRREGGESKGVIEGEAYRLGDYVDADAIIPVRYCTRPTTDALTKHCLTLVDPDFPLRAKRGLILLAGKDFGRGSANENAVRALLLSGVRGVVATSFGLLFRRNAVNMGLPLMISPDLVNSSETGDRVGLDLKNNRCGNLAKGIEFPAEALSEIERGILLAGGLVNWVKRGGMSAETEAN